MNYFTFLPAARGDTWRFQPLSLFLLYLVCVLSLSCVEIRESNQILDLVPYLEVTPKDRKQKRFMRGVSQ